MIYKTADKIRKKLHHEITIAKVREYVERLGYSIVFYNTLKGDVEIVAQGLEEDARTKKAFTYERNAKFIFIDNNVNEEAKLHLLLHELGHVVFHMKSRKTDIDPINAEQQAEAFAYEMISGEHEKSVQKLVSALVCVSLVCVVLLFASFFQKPQNEDLNNVVAASFYSDTSNVVSVDGELSEEAYYITTTGKKYHQADCRYVKGKSNIIALSPEQAMSNYSPCSVCDP